MKRTSRNLFNALAWYLTPFYRRSYSQCGEDLIIAFLFKQLGITRPTYVDIGANDPVVYSNTYGSYRASGHGFLVEPNPALAKRLRRTRPRDTVIEAGVGVESGTLPLYIMKNDALSTFSAEESDRLQSQGYALSRTLEVPLMTVSELCKRYNIARPDLLSLDIEGLDLAVLRTVDFETFRPRIICVETNHVGTQPGESSPISTLLHAQHYRTAAMTPVNMLFVDERL